VAASAAGPERRDDVAVAREPDDEGGADDRTKCTTPASGDRERRRGRAGPPETGRPAAAASTERRPAPGETDGREAERAAHGEPRPERSTCLRPDIGRRTLAANRAGGNSPSHAAEAEPGGGEVEAAGRWPDPAVRAPDPVDSSAASATRAGRSKASAAGRPAI
jgi:hypothetical protein